MESFRIRTRGLGPRIRKVFRRNQSWIPRLGLCKGSNMGNTSDDIKNTVGAAAFAIGTLTAGAAPQPNTNQLDDSQQISQRRTEPARGDVTRDATTSGH